MTQSPETQAHCAMVVERMRDNFFRAECGTWLLWPDGWGGGCFGAWALRALADELDRRNMGESEQGGAA